MANKDYYETLGVSKDAKQNDIKLAFRKLAHKHHPDKGGDEAKFKEINEAYQVLGNEEKRAKYDQFGSGFDQGAASGFDFSGFQNGFSGSNVNFEDLGDMFGGLGGLGDMFGFSSGSSRSGRSRESLDMEAILVINFNEAVFGAEKEIIVDKNIKCEKCGGQGAEPGSKVETCTTCKGQGRVSTVQRTIFGAMQSEAICPNCQGEGKTFSKKCTKCNGQGIYHGKEKMKIRIPEGINEGEAIRLSGKGHAGIKGRGVGDLILRIRVEKSKEFIRKGYDIFSDATISVKQAILGDKINIKTVFGEVLLKIPEGTQSDTNFKIKGKGVPKLRGIGNGDHFVNVKVIIPKSLSRKEKKALEEINI